MLITCPRRAHHAPRVGETGETSISLFYLSCAWFICAPEKEKTMITGIKTGVGRTSHEIAALHPVACEATYSHTQEQ